ncbi:OLC1v1001781C1 [Oldenlandia corymbosa var. corymbosa]|uniref:OLC1v1001781C1 n=1 Tax=Oldenlandia corymbosa var. corymbosa TaxID=529605 RepID=A0AAV1D8V7_OLDCO|nr:OLC1v1001781C1 [Oldenlandia corymbosa var. corymbosa]
MLRNFVVMLQFFVLSVLFLPSPSLFFHVEAENTIDFSFDLIHRDSPESPLYNSSLTSYDHQRNAFQHSIDRMNYLVSTNVLPSGGGYLMKISYGTPSFETLALIDTGSFLSWTQCLPCIHCFTETVPLFDPKNSSTFEFIPCGSKECLETEQFTCDPKSKSNRCSYGILYGGGTIARGDVAVDTITLRSGSDQKNVSIPNFVFGCGNNNTGDFSAIGSGILGFGFGDQSFVSQLYTSIQGKFSYCLGVSTPEVSELGKLKLGPNDVFSSGAGVVSTTLLNLKNFYTVTLEGISVEGTSLGQYSNDIIIDSGTTVTFLPTVLYEDLQSTLKQKINSDELIVPDPLKSLGLCYSSLEGVSVPNVTIHLKGADLELNPVNTFVSTSISSICLAFAPTDDSGTLILGNRQQMNFWVGYDLDAKVVLFKPSDCTAEQ